MALQLGRFSIHALQDGTLRLDGGSMFGALPRREWERAYPPDSEHRIALALRCLVIDTGPRKILVDDGAGEALSDAGPYACSRANGGLDAELARAGLTREAITDVVLTHLHLDHAGGTVRPSASGRLELAFPNAHYHLQRRHLRWAHHPSELDADGFVRAHFELLEHSGRLHLLEGETELTEGVQLCVSEGHTVAMQLVRVQSEDAELVFCADLIPTAAHIPLSVCSSYDLHPLTLVEEKKSLLAQAVEEGTLLCFAHDPHVAACRVRDVDGTVVAGEPVAF